MSKFISCVRLVSLIIALTLLASCSAIRLAYSQAPDLTYWWLDGYVDFNEQQTPKVRDELTKLFAWHRAKELPKTAALLNEAAQLMPGDITPAQACKMFNDVRSLVTNVTDQALPALADFSLTVTPAQIEHMKGKFAKNNAKYTEDFVRGTRAERFEKSLKRSIERSESFYGRLEEAQIDVIKRQLNESSFDAALSNKERLRRQQDLIDRLQSLSSSKASPATAQQSLREYIARGWQSPDPTYRAYAAKLTQTSCQSFANIHNSTNATQRAKAVQVIKGYEQDLLSLSPQK